MRFRIVSARGTLTPKVCAVPYRYPCAVSWLCRQINCRLHVSWARYSPSVVASQELLTPHECAVHEHKFLMTTCIPRQCTLLPRGLSPSALGIRHGVLRHDAESTITLTHCQHGAMNAATWHIQPPRCDGGRWTNGRDPPALISPPAHITSPIFKHIHTFYPSRPLNP